MMSILVAEGGTEMLNIRGVYEVAIRVSNLPRSEAFYKDVLGLEEGLRDEKRNWLFLRAGGLAGMIVLQEDAGTWPKQHFAFTIDEGDIDWAASVLKEKGLEIEGPVLHEWMPAKSVYFDDPDGHSLELCAPVVR
jgi:catechol 2,3-dioxygenase-like lactoylglutathione lyase family enzyme